MIDNFNKIESLLNFEDDIYYHLQIIRRGKDHKDLPAANRMIKSYFICSKEDLLSYEQEIKTLCDLFQARAYINLSPKSIKKTTLLQLKYLSQRIYDNDYKKIWKSWNSCAGEIKGEKPRWVVDLDNITDLQTIENIKYLIYLTEPEGDKIIDVISTKSGYHLITTPFNIQKFKSTPIGETIDIHKNNPTLLYASD